MKRVVCLVALLVPAVLHGQRLPQIPHPVDYAIAVPPTPFHVDTTKVIPPTYWLEGGVIGGVGMGVFGVMFAQGMREDSGSHVAGDVGAFLIGGTLGFTVGALIGGQFPKH